MKNANGEGQALEVEDLDLSGLGLYREKDPTVPEEDYFLTNYTMFGQQLWARKSDEGKKWHIYEDSHLLPWKEIAEKVSKKKVTKKRTKK